MYCQFHKDEYIGYNIDNGDQIRPICSRCIPNLPQDYYGVRRYITFEQSQELLQQLQEYSLIKYKEEAQQQLKSLLNNITQKMNILIEQFNTTIDLIIKNDPQQNIINQNDFQMIANILSENCYYDQKYKIKYNNYIHTQINQIIKKMNSQFNLLFQNIDTQIKNLQEQEINIKSQQQNQKEQGYRELFKLKGHNSQIINLVYYEQFKWLFSISQDINIYQWDLKTKQLITILEGHNDKINCLEIINDNLISCGQDNQLIIWDLNNNKVQIKNKIIVKGNIKIIIKYKQSFATIINDKILGFWNNDKCIHELKNKIEITSIDCNQDFSQIAIGQIDGIIRIRKEQINFKLNGHYDCIKALKYIENGKLISGGWDKQIKIWIELKNGDYQCTQTLYDHQSYINFIKQIGQYIISTDDNNIIKIWEFDKNWKLYNQIGRYSLITAIHIYKQFCFFGLQDNSIIIWQFN